MVCVGYPSKAVFQAAFLLVSPWLPATFPSCPVTGAFQVVHPTSPPSSEPHGSLPCQLSPPGVSEHALSDTWDQGGNVPSDHEGGGDFTGQEKSDFHEAWFP